MPAAGLSLVTWNRTNQNNTKFSCVTSREMSKILLMVFGIREDKIIVGFWFDEGAGIDSFGMWEGIQRAW